MVKVVRRAVVLLSFLAPLSHAQFIDPAPPKVSKPLRAEALQAQKTAELTFHAAPRALAKNAVTAEWPGFLGSTGRPVCPEKPLTGDLQEANIVWEYEKGTGYAAPAIVGERLILFHRIKDKEVIDCLHPQTGQRYWRAAYDTAYTDRYGYTDGPRCSPVIDIERSIVMTLGAEGKLTALDLSSGQMLWQRDLLGEFKLGQNFFGVGSTPLLESGVLVVNLGAKGACVVGIEPGTGKIAWASAAPRDWGPSYAAPVAASVHGVRRVFIFTGGESRPATGGLLCIDPKNGTVDFSFPWRGRRYESVNASAPLVFDDKVYIAECYGKGGVLLQMSKEGETLSAKTAWESDKLSTHFMTALVKDGYLYGCDGHGPNNCPLVCLDAKSGEEKWRVEPDLSEMVTTRTGEKRQVKLSSDRCHLIQADGKTLCLTEWGHLLWLDVSAQGCKVTSRKWLFAAGETWAPPVICRGLLYVVQNTVDGMNNKPRRLMCYDLRGK